MANEMYCDNFIMSEDGENFEVTQVSKGDRGEKGEPGTNFYISGIVANVSDLPETAPQSAMYGVGTEAPYNVYIRNNDQWVNLGPMTGVKGEKGDPGNDYVLTASDKQEIAGIVIDESDIGTDPLETEAHTIKGAINEHENDINGTGGLAQRVTSAESAIDGLAENINGTGGLAQRVTSAESAIDELAENVTALEGAKLIIKTLSISAATSSQQIGSATDARINANTQLIRAEIANPAYQTSDWTVTTYDAAPQVRVNGTCSAATTVKLILAEVS